MQKANIFPVRAGSLNGELLEALEVHGYLKNLTKSGHPLKISLSNERKQYRKIFFFFKMSVAEL